MNIRLRTFIILISSVIINAQCPAPALTVLPFTIEYALWRGWQQAIIYTPDLEKAAARGHVCLPNVSHITFTLSWDESASRTYIGFALISKFDCIGSCHWITVRLTKCLNVNGVAIAKDVLMRPHVHTRLGIIIVSPQIRSNNTRLTLLIKTLQDLKMNTASYDWLIAASSDKDVKQMNVILNATSIRFDQNLVVVYPDHSETTSLGLCDNNFVYRRRYKTAEDVTRYCRSFRYSHNNQSICKTEYERSYFRTSIRYKNLLRFQSYKKSGSILPLFQSGIYNNFSRNFEMVNISRFLIKQQQTLWNQVNRINNIIQGRIYVIQYFKVRINSTLYAHFLGVWNREQSMSRVEPPYPVEARNFLGEELIVGRCNSSENGMPSMDDDGPSAPALLDDILHFLTVRLNSTPIYRYYSKLGFRTYDGTWTGLLGALSGNSVDLALEPVTALSTRHQDMDFIFPIAETMCNIYIRHHETSTARDIFLAPFSARLLACVVAVALFAALAVVLISRVATTIRIEARSMGYAEALIWSTGILCQQGGSCTPSNPAASVLLIVCLLFAVVTYNAYAGFITSVLSVRVASVDTVDAVLHSANLQIGYIRNGADQMYLMSTKDVQLNAFYIRGYSNAENLVSSAEEGLARAASQDYAFFAGQRTARSTLRSLSQARGRCAVRELPVHSTRAHLAFPLPQQSPYARSILISLLQLRSGGALARLEAALVPDMPRCTTPVGFASARATDVRSALILLIIGFFAALVIGLGEYFWKNRRLQWNFWKIFCERLLRIVQINY